MSIDSDEYFELMMNNCWRLEGATTKKNEKKGWNNKEEEGQNQNSSPQKNYAKREAQSAPFDNSDGKNNKDAKANGKKCVNKNTSNIFNIDTQQSTSHVETKPVTNVNQVMSSGRNSNAILEKFRARLLSRGSKGLIGLARQFKIFDDNHNKNLEFDEFHKDYIKKSASFAYTRHRDHLCSCNFLIPFG